MKKKQVLKNDWAPLLNEEFTKPYYLRLREFLKNEYRTRTIYPSMYDIFNALHYTPFSEVKVVILGQDPYHGPNQAHGLAFSVSKNVKIPPSLRNMYKEMVDDLEVPMPQHGQLDQWAKQGVLLLNAVLTVRAGEANSHKDLGWQDLTQKVIESLNQHPSPIVYVLWGASARSYKKYIDLNKHAVIEAVHPSPLSAYRGFFGSKPFSQINQLLIERGESPIDWEIK